MVTLHDVLLNAAVAAVLILFVVAIARDKSPLMSGKVTCQFKGCKVKMNPPMEWFLRFFGVPICGLCEEHAKPITVPVPQETTDNDGGGLNEK